MTDSTILRALALLVLMFAPAACGDDDQTLTSPTPTPPTIVTETFTGTLGPNGAFTHTFASQASGPVTATLSSLAPDNTLVIGMSLGTWNGSLCQIVLANDRATEATVVTGGVSSFGSLCVRVYDVGNVTTPTTYEVTVVHP